MFSFNFCAVHTRSCRCQVIGKCQGRSPEAFKREWPEASLSGPGAVEEREAVLGWEMATGLSCCSDFAWPRCPPVAAFSVVLTFGSAMHAGINTSLPRMFHLVQ